MGKTLYYIASFLGSLSTLIKATRSGPLLGIGLIFLCTLPSLGQTAFMTTEEKRNMQWQNVQGNLQVSLDYGMGVAVQYKMLQFNDSKVNISTTLSPNIGYFIKPQWVVGIHLDTFASLLNVDYQNDYKLYFISSGLYTRYYTKWGIFAEGRFGVGSGKEEYTVSGTSFPFPLTTLTGSSGLGLNHYWHETISLYIILRYQMNAYSLDNDLLRSYVSGANISAGINFTLP
ncbi:hypothetical protein [Algivirga pacifica]|uniref:Outer membrane protein beta-barrel domain-containing protein n=1 Tax=Algivirga pacifica TaxID=1162670 RepID=A0ABP9DBU7_9BACT